MAQELYNEGRVLGFSAWEIFARDAMDHGIPPEDIPTEAEWLAEMICSGKSTILKVPAATPAGVIDFEMPVGTMLTGSSYILGSLFIGTCECDSTGFAKKVTSYGPLINNTASSSPTSDSNDPVPYDTSAAPYASYINSITEFVKINDGIVYTRKAKWIRTPDDSGEPYKDIDPNYGTSVTVVRLYLVEELNADVYVLLTGFENKAFLSEISGWAHEDDGRSAGGSTDMDNNGWKNGNMLGPEVIPWATKIVLTVPSSAYTLSNNITRTIPNNQTYGTGDEINIAGIKLHNYDDYKANATPFIDFDSINLTDYYTVHSFSTSPTITERISEVKFGFTSSCNSVVAWYPGMTNAEINTAKSAGSNAKFFPPAIYAAKVTTTGTQTLVPLDVAAPGTIKCFTNATDAYNYSQLLPNNFAIYYNSANNTYSFVKPGDNNVNNWYSSTKVEYLANPTARISTNTTATKFIALNNSSGTDYNLVGSNGTITTAAARNLKWSDMLTALAEGKTLNILGDRLTKLANDLSSTNKIGIAADDTIAEIGATKVTVAPGTANSVGITGTSGLGNVKMAVTENGTTYKAGTNFIEFSNGLRLYILAKNATPPTTNVPVGSIGIGW